MTLEDLKEKFANLAQVAGKKFNCHWKTRKAPPNLHELVNSCVLYCRSYAEWHEILKGFARIRIPDEFLDKERTNALIQDAMHDASSDPYPEYILLRTYDVYFANSLIRKMLGLPESAFSKWLSTANIMIGIITPDDPLFKMVNTSPKEHDYLVRTNLIWFVKSNEAYFQYRKTVFDFMTKSLNSHETLRRTNVPYEHAWQFHSYLKRMDEIVGVLNSNPFTKRHLVDMKEILRASINHRASQSFRLVNPSGEVHYLRPRATYLESSHFFPELICYKQTKTARAIQSV